MSTGNLQEMGATATNQSKSAVNATAQPGDPMLSNGAFVGGTPGQTITDLGGPTPDNYRSTDDSAKLNFAAVASVRNVVNAMAMRAEEEEYGEEEVISEVEETEEYEEEYEDEVEGEDGDDDEEYIYDNKNDTNDSWD